MGFYLNKIKVFSSLIFLQNEWISDKKFFCVLLIFCQKISINFLFHKLLQEIVVKVRQPKKPKNNHFLCLKVLSKNTRNQLMKTGQVYGIRKHVQMNIKTRNMFQCLF